MSQQRSSAPHTDRASFALHHWGPFAELLLALAAGVLWYTQGGWVSYAGAWPGPLPLILLGMMVILRLVRLPSSPRRRVYLLPLAITFPLALFLFSALLSSYVAYDLGPARAKLWLIVGAVGLYWATAGQSTRVHLQRTLRLWGGVGAGIAAFFLLTADWSASPFPLQGLASLVRPLASLVPPAIASESLNPNVAAGIMVIVLPLFVPIIRGLWFSGHHGAAKREMGLSSVGRWALLGMAVIALGVVLFSCLVTASRGAWLALGLTAALWSVWRLSGRLRWGIRLASASSTAACACLLLWGVGRTIYDGPSIGPFGGLHEALTNRVMLAKLGALLARDTLFTGVGLGMFEMHFSIYTLLIHVGFVEHSHDVLLDLSIEQGILGVAAYGAMVASAIFVGVRELGRLDKSRRRCSGGPGNSGDALSCRNHSSDDPMETISDGQWLIEAALASAIAIFLHGLVDDPVYGSRAVLFLFVPFGALVAALRVTRDLAVSSSSDRPTASSGRGLLAALCVSASASVAIPLLFVWLQMGSRGGMGSVLSRLQAAWYANRGVIAQSGVELSIYDQHHFDDPTMDQVRQNQNLDDALEWFRRALARDPTQTTASQRMASIALARAQYDDAFQLMRNLWEAGHRDRVTRLLYGDALVAQGRVDEAVDAVRGVSFARSRLLGQAWSRYHVNGDAERELWARQAAERLTD